MKNVCPKNPCPFCGANLENDPPSSIWYHPSNGCLLSLRAISGEQQIEKWDKRPTAYWRGDYDGYADGNPVYDIWHCSSCEYCIDDGTDDPELLPKYCPNCGARMVNVYEQDNKNR